MATTLRRIRRRAARMPLVARARGRRAVVSVPPDTYPRWVAVLDGARWLPDHVLELRGWAYLAGMPSPPGEPVVVELQDRACGRVVRIAAAVEADPEVNTASGEDVDHAWAAFTARCDARTLRTGLSAGDEPVGLDVAVEIVTAEGIFRGPFSRRNEGGSAGGLTCAALPDGRHVQPRWSAQAGLRLVVSVPCAVARTATPTAGGLRLDLAVAEGFAPVRAVLRGLDRPPMDVHLEVEGESLVCRLAGAREPAGSSPRTWTLDLVDARDRGEAVRWGGQSEGDRVPLGGGLALEITQGSTLRLVQDPRALVVTAVEHVEQPTSALVLRGSWSGAPGTVLEVALHGRRTQVSGPGAAVGPDGRFEAVVPLVVPSESGSPLPLRAGRYRVVATASGTQLDPRVSPTCAGQFDRRDYRDGYDLRVTRREARLAVEVSAPLAADEIGTFHQARLRAEAAKGPVPALAGTYFESWFGRSVSDNPLAVYREMVERGVGEPYAWAVTDLSVAVPEGSRAVVVGTREWWRTATTSKVVVLNFWQRPDFVKRKGQVVVQTWHGTPLKLLGLDRPTKSGRPGSIRKIQRDIRAWDHLVSQNAHSSDVFRRAYLWERPILEIGYPRDDVVARAAPGHRARIRQALGLRDGEVVVLYAPTWREDDRSRVGVLDLERVAARLGPQFRLLVRGHATSLRTGSPIEGESVLDVTTYPDVADLIVASDLLVTDYSSIMFDYSVSGRPILFYVPDLDDYAGTRRSGLPWRRRDPDPAKARGVYFDLATIAPGPLLTRAADLLAAIRAHEELAGNYREAYAAWRARFNPHDDGGASARLVDAVYGPA